MTGSRRVSTRMKDGGTWGGLKSNPLSRESAHPSGNLINPRYLKGEGRGSTESHRLTSS
jgi:hypothetical protein